MSSDTVRNAQLWVATTEKFEALYRRSSLRDFIATVGCLIIDEVHLVGDPTRGATLESLIARLRAVEGRTRIVALSATVSNAEELAGWFNAQLVRSAWRPTILTTQLIPYDAPPPGSKREDYEAAKDAALDPLLRELRADARRIACRRGKRRVARAVCWSSAVARTRFDAQLRWWLASPSETSKIRTSSTRRSQQASACTFATPRGQVAHSTPSRNARSKP